jgi:hypothetical protein
MFYECQQAGGVKGENSEEEQWNLTLMIAHGQLWIRVAGAHGRCQKSGGRSKGGPAASSEVAWSLQGSAACAERSWPGLPRAR